MSTYNDYILEHHGIKGMKWGVRRFERKDGTLTPAGKKRYSLNSGDTEGGITNKPRIPNGAKVDGYQKQKRLIDTITDGYQKQRIPTGARGIAETKKRKLPDGTKIDGFQKQKLPIGTIQENPEKKMPSTIVTGDTIASVLKNSKSSKRGKNIVDTILGR